MLRLAEVLDRFTAAYAELLAALTATGLPAVVRTVYEPRSADPAQRLAIATVLAIFDDAILCLARRARLPVLDLRAIYAEAADFANPVEPSVVGGAKLANALGAAVRRHNVAGGGTALFP